MNWKVALRAGLLLAATLSVACAVEDPGDDLVPVPRAIRIDEFDPAVRAQYADRRAALDRLIDGPSEARELAEAYCQLGIWHHAYRDLELARLCYRHASRLMPEDSRWIYYLGYLYSVEGRVEPARQAFRRFLELQPGHPAALVRLAEMELKAGRADEAQDYFESSLQADPRSARALAGLGDVALQKRDFAAAARHLEKALEIQPDSIGLRYSLGLAYRGLDLGERAAAQMAHGRHGGSGSPALDDPLMDVVAAVVQGQRKHEQQGLEAYREGDYETAISAARSAVEAEPDEAMPRLNLGAALLSSGRPAEAAAAFRNALEISPGHPVAHFNLGVTLSHLGRAWEAEEEYRAAVLSNPEYREARFNLANLLRQRFAWAEALGEYHRVVEIDPNFSRARLWRAVCLLRLGRAADALRTLERDLTILPSARALRLLRARILATSSDATLRDGGLSLSLARELFARRPSLDSAEAIAAANAELGLTRASVAWQSAALAAVRRGGSDDLVDRVARRLALYQAGDACREPWAAGEFLGAEIVVEAPVSSR